MMPTGIELRLGDWREVLADVDVVDAIVTDPPYSARTHAGHGSMARWGTTVPHARDGSQRREIGYAEFSPDDCHDFADSWAPRCRGWSVICSDDNLIVSWREAWEKHGRTGFQDIPAIIKGMSVRMCGDGPSSWAVHLNVSRPPRLSTWGTLDGAYVGPSGQPQIAVGGKPLWLMRAIIRDYTRPGDLVCDPCAGGATTLLAAAIEGRRAIGAEIDPHTYELAKRRLEAGFTPLLPGFAA